VRPFKGVFCVDISEFESYMPSQAVWSLWVCSRDRIFGETVSGRVGFEPQGRRQLAIGRMLIESQLFELKRHIEAAGVIAPFLFPLVIG
jgi:hypothetical protein